MYRKCIGDISDNLKFYSIIGIMQNIIQYCRCAVLGATSVKFFPRPVSDIIMCINLLSKNIAYKEITNDFTHACQK